MSSPQNSPDNAELARIADTLADIRRLLQGRFAPLSPAVLDEGRCWRWEITPVGGRLTPIRQNGGFDLQTLVGIDNAVRALCDNTRLFLRGRPANHALLTGPRGCGKSSLIRGVFGKFQNKGLRLIETDVAGLAALPALQNVLAAREENYILYCDDLSFSAGDPLFGKIKTAIDGGIGGIGDSGGKLLIYATSNRRNLVAENHADNAIRFDDAGDIQPLETLNEKTALADRFGLWLPFSPPSMDDYDKLAAHWLGLMRVRVTPALLAEARQFSDYRGSVNGRIARQFAIIAAGKKRTPDKD